MRKQQQQRRESFIDDASINGSNGSNGYTGPDGFEGRIGDETGPIEIVDLARTSAPAPGVEDTESLYADQAYEEKVRTRAYEIYLNRYEAGGSAERDWFQAEREVTRGSQSQR